MTQMCIRDWLGNDKRLTCADELNPIDKTLALQNVGGMRYGDVVVREEIWQEV